MTTLSPATAALVVFIAKWGLLGPALLAAYSVVRRREWRFDAIVAALSGLATLAIVKTSGAMYHHVRPFVAWHTQPLIAHISDNSFPSDHLAACGLAVGFLWTRSRMLACVAAVFALALGVARVAAGLHWPIDVVGGFVEGLVGSAIGTLVSRALASRLFS